MGQTMIILYAFASVVGALSTSLVLSSCGWVVALACAPAAGTGVAFGLALLVAWTERGTEAPADDAAETVWEAVPA